MLVEYFRWQFDEIPCNYIPPFHELISPECGGCLLIPSVGSLRKVHFSNLNNYDEILQFRDYRDRPLCFHPNTSFKYLDMSANRDHGYQDVDLFTQTDIKGLTRLRFVNNSRNSLTALFRNVSTSYPRLQHLDVSHNMITLREKRTLSLQELVKAIEVLNLSHNHISHIDINTFAGLEELRHLDLSNNLIYEFDINLSSSKSLTYLDLSSNKINSLSLSTINQLNKIAMVTDNHTLKVDLRGNSLTCTCATKDFVAWVIENHPPNLEFVNNKAYFCNNRVLDRVALSHVTVNMLNTECYENVIYGCVGAILVVTLTTMLTAYKRRFYLHHKWYRWNKRMRKRYYSQGFHEYDAFICFDRADSDWVDYEAKWHLSRFKIAYGEQGIEFGQHLHQAVCQYIERSHRSILVLSPNFVNSPNSLYHMRIVEGRLKLTGNDILIVVILKPLNRLGLDRTLKELMEHRLCLEWKEDNWDAQGFFWEQLTDATEAPCEELYDAPPDERTALTQ